MDPRTALVPVFQYKSSFLDFQVRTIMLPGRPSLSEEGREQDWTNTFLFNKTILTIRTINPKQHRFFAMKSLGSNAVRNGGAIYTGNAMYTGSEVIGALPGESRRP